MTSKLAKIDVKEAAHTISRIETLRDDGVCACDASLVIVQECSAEYSEAKRGFTLIELLVVVLIIGILASVALPEYKKAVRKARLSEVATTFNAISKSIDMYLLENGWPASYVNFIGTGKTAELDVSIPCATQNATECYTKTGGWFAGCWNTYCQVGIHPGYDASGNSGNKWAGDTSMVAWQKYPDTSFWQFSFLSDAPEDVCRWAVNFLGKDKFEGEATSDCANYL